MIQGVLKRQTARSLDVYLVISGTPPKRRGEAFTFSLAEIMNANHIRLTSRETSALQRSRDSDMQSVLNYPAVEVFIRKRQVPSLSVTLSTFHIEIVTF